MAAYAFARLRFPFRERIFAIYIAALMVPGIVTTIPNFILVRGLGGMNNYLGIAAPTLLMTPFAVFFLRQFFLGVNREVEEASTIDGASIWTTFIRVVVPITMPALTTLAIVTLIATWNSYLWPLIIGSDPSVRVLTVALGIFRSQTPQGAPDWTGLMAGTTIAIIPTFIIFMLLGAQDSGFDSVHWFQIKDGLSLWERRHPWRQAGQKPGRLPPGMAALPGQQDSFGVHADRNGWRRNCASTLRATLPDRWWVCLFSQSFVSVLHSNSEESSMNKRLSVLTAVLVVLSIILTACGGARTGSAGRRTG